MGARLARRLEASGREVRLLRRSGPDGIDLARHVPRLEGTFPAAWWLLAPPPGATEAERQAVYREGTANFLEGLLRAGHAGAVVVVGSTGIHDRDDGGEVDEAPLDRVLAGARNEPGLSGVHLEQLEVCARYLEAGLDVRWVGCAGIYGPFRTPAGRIARGMPTARGGGAARVNLIHIDDLVERLAAAPEWAPRGKAVHVSDGAPGTLAAYYAATARLWGLPEPGPWADDGSRGRCVSTARLAALCPDFRPRDLASGLAASHEAER